MIALSPSFLLSITFKATVVLGLAGVLALVLRRESAAIRHSVWSLGLAGALALPFLGLALPRWPVLTLPALPARLAALSLHADVPASDPPSAIRGVIRAAPPGGRPAPIVALPPAAEPIRVVALAPPPAPVDLASALLAVWLGGAGLFLAWIALGEYWVRRLSRRARPADATEWTGLLPEAFEALGIGSRVQVLETDRSIVPLTYGVFQPVVVVPAAGRDWSAAHRRDVLLHELAHVARRDCLTQSVARIACAIHWFNPLAWLALRQLRIEREHASDDAVLNAGALPSRYAEELLSTAQALGSAPPLASAGLAMARRSELADRLLSVLDDRRRRTPMGTRSWAGMACAGGALIVPLAALGAAKVAPAPPARPVVAEWPAPAAPEAPVAAIRAEPPAPAAPLVIPSDPFAPSGPRTVVAAAPERGIWARLSSLVAAPAPTPLRKSTGPTICPPDPKGHDKTVHLSSSMSITGEGNASDGQNSWVVWSGHDCSVTIRTNGKVTFDDAEQDVASISSGGRFVVTHEDGDRQRTYTVTARRGELQREYRVDGKDAEMDEGFARWRATLVLEYIRRTAYDAANRAKRILAAKGVDGLLAEIDEIASDWAKGQYFRALVSSGSLDDPTTARIVDQVGRTLESDYEKGQVLGAIEPRHLENEAVRQAFTRAAGPMSSDYEKRQVLSKVLAVGKPSPVVTSTMLDLAATIESDYEVAELLIGLAKTGAVTGAFDPAYLKALGTIESDYEKHRALAALFASGPRPQATVAAALEAATTIESDYELASFLVELAQKGLITKDLRPLFRRALEKIGSTYERQRALAALGAKDADI
jgi:beta-lactamase regulating signal transducer with metallopeptidase domain